MADLVALTDEGRARLKRQAQRARSIRLGQYVTPVPLWNESERPPHHLPDTARVLGMQLAQCQTGVMLKVKQLNGHERWLDAAWFKEVADG